MSFAVLLLTAAQAMADDKPASGPLKWQLPKVASREVYKNLPGVKPYTPDYAKEKNPIPQCDRGLIHLRHQGEPWPGQAVIAYDCEQDGVHVMSTESPRVDLWEPGISDMR